MNKTYKNTTIAILLACILTMAIGYAILNQKLNISGTTKIGSNFNIQVTGINEYYTEGTPVTTNLDFTPTSATFSTNLTSPGDFVYYEITIENKGTLNGYVEFVENEEGWYYYNNEGWWYNRNDYGAISENGVLLGVVYASKTHMTTTSWDDYVNQETPTGLTSLAPGEKLYVYGVASLDSRITSLPEKTKYDISINFNFYTRDNYSNDVVISGYLYDKILENEPVVTTGNGLYYNGQFNDGSMYYYDEHIYRSDKDAIINNYVQLNNKIWRIISMRRYYYTEYEENPYIEEYYVIEDDDTINSNIAYSTTADSNNYYNNYEPSLFEYIKNTVPYYDDWDERGVVAPDVHYYDNEPSDYIENTKLFVSSAAETQRYASKSIIDIRDIMNASTSTTCTFANLSTGGCQSWLTDNGNTYLFNPVYESDETTNTGKIAYLEDGKIITVDPQDTSYGQYKVHGYMHDACRTYLKITNYETADGSKINPYIIDIEAASYANSICG